MARTAAKVGMKKTVYIETTVVSYYTARPSRDLLVAAHQEATHELWPRLATDFDSFVSELVVEEAGRGDPGQASKRLEAIQPFASLAIDDESEALAGKILAAKAIPEQYNDDALHVAIAAANGVEVLVTWNFAHLNNPFARMMVRQVVENAGFVCPEICTPDELLETRP